MPKTCSVFECRSGYRLKKEDSEDSEIVSIPNWMLISALNGFVTSTSTLRISDYQPIAASVRNISGRLISITAAVREQREQRMRESIIEDRPRIGKKLKSDAVPSIFNEQLPFYATD